MIYELALLVLVAVALHNGVSRPFAFVLAAIWLIDAALARTGQYLFIPWVDAFGVYPLLFLTLRQSKWWSVACSCFALLALPIHLWFWAFYLQGIDVVSVYVAVQNTLFLLSVAVLIAGTTNVRQLYDSAMDRIRSLRGYDSGVAGACRRSDRAV